MCSRSAWATAQEYVLVRPTQKAVAVRVGRAGHDPLEMLGDLGEPVGVLGRLPHLGVLLDHVALAPAQRSGVGAFGKALTVVAGHVVRFVGVGQFGRVKLRQRAAGTCDQNHLPRWYNDRLIGHLL